MKAHVHPGGSVVTQIKDVRLRTLGAGTLLAPGNEPWVVELRAPAISVMTDFNERRMVTVDGQSRVDDALSNMKHGGVRAGFVVDNDKRYVLGLLTAYDIMGEKPLRHELTMGCTRDEVLVHDIMEATASWVVADYSDITRLSVGDVLKLLQDEGRTHLPVVEKVSQGTRLRGLFSSAKLLRLTEPSRRGG